MAAIDIVTANEFTFTPSAFIAAYIEQEETTTVTDSTTNGGTLNVEPKDISNISGTPLPPLIAGDSTRPRLPSVRVGSGAFDYDAPFKKHPLSNYGVFADIGDTVTTEKGTGTTLPTITTGQITALSSLSATDTFAWGMGILASANGNVSASGSLADLIGQITTDTRTTTKTTTTATGAANTVVLVLSYGQFKAKCANAQNTVSAIYSAVSSYLNTL